MNIKIIDLGMEFLLLCDSFLEPKHVLSVCDIRDKMFEMVNVYCVFIIKASQTVEVQHCCN